MWPTGRPPPPNTESGSAPHGLQGVSRTLSFLGPDGPGSSLVLRVQWPEGVEHRSAGCLQGRGPGPFPGRGRRRPTGPRLGVGRGHGVQARGRENQASESRGARGQGPRRSEVSKVPHITDSSGRVACGRDGSVPEKPTGEERGEEKTLFMPRPQVIHWAARSCPLCLAPCAHCLQLGRLRAPGGRPPARLPAHLLASSLAPPSPGTIPDIPSST